MTVDSVVGIIILQSYEYYLLNLSNRAKDCGNISINTIKKA